jgi:hypothetical protein
MNENKRRIIEEWWTDDQKALVEDASALWVRTRFEKVPGYWVPINGGKMLTKVSKDEKIPERAVVENTTWDHENCELCRQTISEYHTHQQEGYTDGKSWLCVDCYNNYIGEVTNA